jgi:uncharacterized OB-fold protein
MKQRHCPKCGTNWSSNSKFCSRDGTPLVDQELPNCQCGEAMMPSQEFCDQCGRPRTEALKQLEPAPSPS